MGRDLNAWGRARREIEHQKKLDRLYAAIAIGRFFQLIVLLHNSKLGIENK